MPDRYKVALVGGVSRYRYPEDPLIFVVIAVGLAGAAGLLRSRWPKAEFRIMND